jgi:hypothetical protein
MLYFLFPCFAAAKKDSKTHQSVLNLPFDTLFELLEIKTKTAISFS